MEQTVIKYQSALGKRKLKTIHYSTLEEKASQIQALRRTGAIIIQVFG